MGANPTSRTARRQDPTGIESRVKENMKEIKYRVWNIRRKDMNYNPSYFLLALADHYNGGTEDIFIQYTGLKDKNGKEIYEGDIIRGHDTLYTEHIHRHEVKWSEYNCGFNPFASYDSDCGIYSRPENYEIIGNIYENPELLTS